MTALLALRETLAGVLATELGTYTLGNGSTTPAIRCSGPTETRYPGTLVSGIELVILKDPRLVPVRQYEEERVTVEWTAFLIAWGNRPASIAAQLVVDAVPGCEVERIEVPQGIGPSDQYQLTILSPAGVPLDALVPAGQERRALTTLDGRPLVMISGRQLVTR